MSQSWRQRACSERSGRQVRSIDAPVGNAGVFDINVTLPELLVEDIETSFEELFGINVFGYLIGARAVPPELVENEERMIFIASQADLGRSVCEITEVGGRALEFITENVDM